MTASGGFLSRFKAAARKLIAKLRSRPPETPPRWPNLAPPEPINADAAEHAVDFSIRWYDRLEDLTRKRLAKLGIPKDQIGAFDQDFDLRLAAFHPKEHFEAECPGPFAAAHQPRVPSASFSGPSPCGAGS